MTGARILLATGNAHKVAEIQAILGAGWQVEARDPEVEETGATFEENALIKARALARASGELAIADDSGIEIEALGGAPGVHSARWTDEGDWIPRVLRELDGAGPAGRRCRYVCAAAAVWPDLPADGPAGPAGQGAGGAGSGASSAGGVGAAGPGAGGGGGSGASSVGTGEVAVRGTVDGVVADAPRGTGGFGYDPIMVPVEGDGRTFAEMSEAEKHALSHRGRAFRLLAPHLST